MERSDEFLPMKRNTTVRVTHSETRAHTVTHTDTHTFAPLRCRAEHVVALCCGVRRRRGPAL